MVQSNLRRLIFTVGVLTSSTLGQQLALQNPADLQIQIRSATGSNRFRIGEEIPIKIELSSTAPNRYLEPCELFIERNFGFPQCRFFSQWSFAITPEDGWVDFTKMFGGLQMRGGPTIPVPDRNLVPQPARFACTLSDRFRFDKPGEYHIRLSIQIGLDDETTQRKRNPDPLIQPHSVSVTRELVLQIVPAGAEWQEEIVRRGKEAYSAPRPPTTDSSSPTLVQYQQATRALCILGTPEAAQVLAEALARGNYEVQKCLQRSPNVANGIEKMQRLLVDPGVAVSPGFFQALVLLLNLDASKKAGVSLLSHQVVNNERDTLFAALPQKRGEAQVSSLVTVLQNPPRSEPTASGSVYELPFAPPVIAAAATSFDRLPLDFQERLLQDAWDSVRSPAMLPVVRRKAQAGDGPALLRWKELDPAAATAFTREEIVRQQPRLSSYYLRLPNDSLPGEDLQVAANFVALTNELYLVHAATLLHRYATRAVLPTVLPIIDANLAEWPCSIQLPVLAYLLKVSPDEAGPRVEQALKNDGTIAECTNSILTHLGFLEPSPVLERFAIAQIGAGGPSALDGTRYLKQYGSLGAKAQVWEQLQRWHRRFVASGAEKRVSEGNGTQEDIEQSEMVSELTTTFAGAHGWVLTPDEADRLEAMLSKDAVSRLRCVFQCDASLSSSHSVGANPTEYAIYADVNHPGERWQSPLEYLNPVERLHYSIKQYHCSDMKALEQKLLQLPAGSTFTFTDDFTARDRDEVMRISDFLETHGYKAKNARDWSFPTGRSTALGLSEGEL